MRGLAHSRRLIRRTGPADGVACVVVVGLGNPGAEFEETRHNAGADAVDLLVGRLGADLRKERALRARVWRGHPFDMAADLAASGPEAPLVLAVPTVFMNESGLAVRALAQRYTAGDPSLIVVVHDDLDLAPGRVKVKSGGAAAGHNGLRSIQAHLRSSGFWRVRIGIGKPPSSAAGARYVLSRPAGRDAELHREGVRRAAEALAILLERGPTAAMDAANQDLSGRDA